MAVIVCLIVCYLIPILSMRSNTHSLWHYNRCVMFELQFSYSGVLMERKHTIKTQIIIGIYGG